MSSEIPAPLKDLTAQLSKLPGMGPKSAMRIVMTLLRWPADRTRGIGQAIYTLRDKLHLCQRCGGLSTTDMCPICADATRRTDILCLVTDWDSMLTLDSGGFFRGQYLVLGGLISPLDQRGPEQLDIPRLVERLAEGEITELVLALGATIEADNTAGFIHNLIHARYPDIRISRLAQGIPLGGEVKHMDPETLRQSLKYRQDLTC